MKKFKGYLRFIYVVYAVLWFSLKGYIGGLFSNREVFYRKRIGPDGRKIMKRVGSTLEIKGLENLDKDKNYVFVGNHRSYTDILAIFLAMASAGRDIVFMSKKEIFSVPLLGGAMKSIGIIGVERGNSSKAMRSMLEAVKEVKGGRDFVIFPEGTRSADGKLGPFKKGGFIIASRAGADVAPFVLKNTEKFMPKSGFAIYPADVTIEFLPVVSSKGLTDTALMEKCEEEIKRKL